MLPLTNPARYTSASLPLAIQTRLARAGGRAFALRCGGDITVTLPNVSSAATFLVPRGFGHPLPARRVGTDLRAEPGGEPCSAARWVPTGGVAAWLRAVPAPRGPTRAVAATVLAGPGGGESGLWIYVRPSSLAWSAARLRSPSAGHGAVAVADRRILAPSPAARIAGVTRGMSRRLALRRCPGLTFVPPVSTDLRPELEQRLTMLFGAVTTRRAGFLARLPESSLPRPSALDVGEHLSRLLWQELGVEARVSIASTEAGAVALAAWLEPGWVGVVAAGADEPLASRPEVGSGQFITGARKAAWLGQPTPDLEGTVSNAGILAATLTRTARGASLRLFLRGTRGERRVRVRVPLSCGRRGLVHLVEAIVRREGAALGAIEALRLSVHPTRTDRPARARSLADMLRTVAERAGEERTIDMISAVQARALPRAAANAADARNAELPAQVQLSLLPWP